MVEISDLKSDKSVNKIKLRSFGIQVKILQFGFLIILSVLLVWLSYKAFTYAAISKDSGYYLAVAARIAEGWIPFKDLYLEYPPVGMYFYSIIAGSTSYFHIESYYLITYLFLIGIGTGVYLIAFLFVSDKLLASIAGVFTIVLSLYFQGYSALLEPFTVFFYIASLFFVVQGIQLNKNINFFIAGIFVFLSFFSKQYGLLVLPAIFIYILMSDFNLGRKVFIYILMFLGFAFCGVLIGTYYTLNGVTLTKLLSALSGSGAGSGTYGVHSLSAMLKAIIPYIIRAELFLLVIPIIFLLDKKIRKEKNIVFLLTLNFCGFLPLYFADYTHYYQLIVPFSVLLGVYLIFYSVKLTQSRAAFLVCLGAVVVSFLLTTILISKISFQFHQTNFRYTRLEQLEQAQYLQKAVPPRSQVFMAGAEEMYSLCNYLPVNSKKYGYMFQGWFNPKDVITFIKPGQYLIIPEYNFNEYKTLVTDLTEVASNREFYVYKR